MAILADVVMVLSAIAVVVAALAIRASLAQRRELDEWNERVDALRRVCGPLATGSETDRTERD